MSYCILIILILIVLIIVVIMPKFIITHIPIFPIPQLVFYLGYVILSLIPLNKTVSLTNPKAIFYGCTKTSTLVKCLYLTGQYEPSATKMLTRLLKPNDVMVDIGANEGYFSILAGSLGAKVYAVEPDPNNLIMLKNNIALNGLNHKITVLPVAASDHTGDIILHQNTINGMWSSISLKGNSNSSFMSRQITVPARQIQQLIHDSVLCAGNTQHDSVSCTSSTLPKAHDQVKLVKMDVEGHELQALNGMKDWIGSVPYWIVETDQPQVIELFKTHGYNVHYLPVDSVALSQHIAQPILIDHCCGFGNYVMIKINN